MFGMILLCIVLYPCTVCMYKHEVGVCDPMRRDAMRCENRDARAFTLFIIVVGSRERGTSTRAATARLQACRARDIFKSPAPQRSYVKARPQARTRVVVPLLNKNSSICLVRPNGVLITMSIVSAYANTNIRIYIMRGEEYYVKR